MQNKVNLKHYLELERTYPFYNSNEGTEKPGLTGTVLNSKQWFKAGDYTDFDQIIKKDGYWWCRFKFDNKGECFYVALCRIHDKSNVLNQKLKSCMVRLVGINMI